MACRAMNDLNIDFGLFTETKFTHDKYTHDCFGYHIYSTTARSPTQGGVAIFYRPNCHYFSVESIRTHGPNVISCELIIGSKHWNLVGAYIPPSDLVASTLEHIAAAIRSRSKRYPLVLLGDFNLDLHRYPSTTREILITTYFDELQLQNLEDYFPHPTGRWTWSQIRTGKSIQSTTDYILTTIPHAFARWTLRIPPLYHSDHRCVLAEFSLSSDALKQHRRYINRRK